MNEKNRKLFSELVEKVKTLRAELKVIEDEKRGLSNQFAETLEALKKKVLNDCFVLRWMDFLFLLLF